MYFMSYIERTSPAGARWAQYGRRSIYRLRRTGQRERRDRVKQISAREARIENVPVLANFISQLPHTPAIRAPAPRTPADPPSRTFSPYSWRSAQRRLGI
ncbi:hypothetical protein EVAR_58112_1 [Eumeta japonica]|uniref:Uncharacterized protein n=1 Tax=Eumeta variegata TaxID=151549 RepID=A0A4C1YK81_EUMVA|nr:hypothetical protein EVAR_58112_1 [Eumeta japonica]